MAHSWISAELAHQLGWTLANSLWEGALVAAIIASVLACLPRRAAHARYFALVLAISVLFAAAIVTFTICPESQAMPSLDLGQFSSGTSHPQLASQTIQQPSVPPSQALFFSEHLVPAHETPDLLPQLNRCVASASPSVANLWLSIVMILAAWRVAGWVGAQRLRIIQTHPIAKPVLETAQRLAKRLGLTTPFQVLISHFAESPMVIGWWRPVILIPAAALAGLTPSQLEGILAHELAHIRRHDYLVNILQILVETLMFYHPAVWWISKQIRLEREQACDDLAIALCADPHEYAVALATIEELRVTGPLVLAANGSGGRQMLARIERIFGIASPKQPLGLSAIAALCILATTSAALIHTETSRADSAGASTQPFVMRNNAPRLSPFTAVRWHGDQPEVQFQGNWYRPVSINDFPTTKILAYLRDSHDFAPAKHFAEDIVEVLRDMGAQPGDSVKLQLETLDSHHLVTIPAAPMTAENRRSVYEFDHPPHARQVFSGKPSTTQPFSLQNDAKRLSPFTAVRWSGNLPQVRYAGTWHELVSINGLPAGKILSYLKDSDDFAPQKHFAEDMVEVMRDMGSTPGDTVKLVLKALGTDQETTIPDAPMTEENRRSVLNFDNQPQSAQPGQDASQPAAADTIFPFNVPFQQGAMKFLDGDEIAVTSVKGTSPNMDTGICCITGTYKLTSHDTAILAASVTADQAGLEKAHEDDEANSPTSAPSGPAMIALNTTAQHYADLKARVDDAKILYGSANQLLLQTLERQEQQAYLDFKDAEKRSKQLDAAQAAGGQGLGAWNAAQTTTIQKGEGSFTLLLPVNIKGWPHISFYSESSDFAGVYIGTGAWVLRRW
jgi:beta-lactamase regulating signal transducer with metallopeptidase domain